MDKPPIFVGIDVSKRRLDIHSRPSGESSTFGYDDESVAALIERLVAVAPALIVLEATGGMEVRLAAALAAAGLPVAVVNPRQVRDFARASGKLAKTDAIDAAVILSFAQVMQPPAVSPPAAAQLRLSDLVRRRRQLVDMLAMEKQHRALPEDPEIVASIRGHLDFLAEQIEQIDHSIDRQIQNDLELAHRAELLRTIPGFGAITAATLIAEVPELGRIGKKQIAALLGVAPMNRDSGQMRGQAHIAGGRRSARCILYMATIVAIRVNPVIKPFYKRLRQEGKAPKVAIVAAMRKLILAANAMLEQNRPWANGQA